VTVVQYTDAGGTLSSSSPFELESGSIEILKKKILLNDVPVYTYALFSHPLSIA